MSQGLIKNIITFPEIFHMNIPTLVAAYVVFYRMKAENKNINAFANMKIDDVVQKLMLDFKTSKSQSAADNKELMIKHRVDILRYIFFIIKKTEG